MIPFKNHISRQNGLTIIEAVIYTSLLFIIIVSGYKYYQIAVCQYGVESNKAELFQDLRTAVSMIYNDISLCGCDPLNNGRVGFVNETDNNDRYDTDANSIHMTSDLEYPWDGKALEQYETIIYFLYPQENGLFKLGRCTGNGRRPQPVAENIVSLHFDYYDLSGNIMSDPPLPLSTIGSVEFSIAAESSNINPFTHKKERVTLKTRVWVRNNLF
jgi:hypothetical protein